jgi:hypothetical protein
LSAEYDVTSHESIPPFPFRVRWREHKILIDDVVDGSMLLFLVPIATIDDEGLGVNPVSPVSDKRQHSSVRIFLLTIVSSYGTNTLRNEVKKRTKEQHNMPPQQEGSDAWQKEQDGDSSASKQSQEPDESSPHLSMEQLDPYQSAPRLSVLRRESFIMDFVTSKGPPQIVFLCMLLAMGFGSTIGVVRTYFRYSG